MTSRDAIGVGARVPTARLHMQGAAPVVNQTVSSLTFRPKMVSLLPVEAVTYSLSKNESHVESMFAGACDCTPDEYGKCLAQLVEPTSIRNEEEYSFDFYQGFHVGDSIVISLEDKTKGAIYFQPETGKNEIGYDVTGSSANTLFRDDFGSDQSFLESCEHSCGSDPNCKGFVDNSKFIHRNVERRACILKLEVHRPHDDANSVLYTKKFATSESRVITKVFCSGKILEVDRPFSAAIFPDVSVSTDETFVAPKLAAHQPIARFDDAQDP